MIKCKLCRDHENPCNSPGHLFDLYYYEDSPMWNDPSEKGCDKCMHWSCCNGAGPGHARCECCGETMCPACGRWAPNCQRGM
jgi:hypothetical protein